jgi:hypothetical protein
MNARAVYLIAGLLLLGAVGVIAQAPAPDPAPAGATPARDIVKPAPSSPAAATNPGAIVLEYKMELLDKDNDGHVSRAEASGVPTLAKVFDKFDRNRDGRLDRVELEAAEKEQPR